MRNHTVVAGAALAAVTLLAFLVLWRDSAKGSGAASSSATEARTMADPDPRTPPPLPAGLSGLASLSPAAGAPPPQRQRQSVPPVPPPPAAGEGRPAAIPAAPSTPAAPVPGTAVAPAREASAMVPAPPPAAPAEAPPKAVAPPLPKPAPPPITTPSPPVKPAPPPVMASHPPPDVVLTGNVARAQLAAGMNGLEPGAPLPLPLRLGQGQERRTVYFFTELRGLSGHTVLHRWEVNGRIVQERPLRPTSQAWRGYTALSITSASPGSWRVAAIDAATGRTLAEQRFRVE